MANAKFYVYRHLRADTKEVFYVGKGYGKRAWNKSSRTNYWLSIVAKHGLIVDVMIDQIEEEKAFDIEKKLIAFYGRKNLGIGPLINLTDGGDGPAGMKLREQVKTQIGLSNRGKKHSPETRAKISAIGKARWAKIKSQQKDQPA